MELSNVLAKRVSDRVNREWGDRVCTPKDVQTVYAEGQLQNPAIASRILQELDELGLLPS